MCCSRRGFSALESTTVEYEYMKKDAESLFKKGFRIAYF